MKNASPFQGRQQTVEKVCFISRSGEPPARVLLILTVLTVKISPFLRFWKALRCFDLCGGRPKTPSLETASLFVISQIFDLVEISNPAKLGTLYLLDLNFNMGFAPSSVFFFLSGHHLIAGIIKSLNRQRKSRIVTDFLTETACNYLAYTCSTGKSFLVNYLFTFFPKKISAS